MRQSQGEGILFTLVSLDGQIGYDVQVLDEEITLDQYLDGLNQMQERYFDQCYGCDGCCWERAPLNGIDILRYCRALWPDELTAPYSFFLEHYGHVHNDHGVLDMMLRRGENGACIFLEQAKKYCTTHTCRSLVCQSYICIPQTERALELRRQIVNMGIDDLARRYYLECQALGKAMTYHSGEGKMMLSDYPENGFSGKTDFCEVKLKDVVSKELWQKLCLSSAEEPLMMHP